MKYFYSGAAEDGDSQTDPNLSLGGNISDTPIPNDVLQNIFSEASYLAIEQQKRETKLIVLQNDDLSKSATAITITFNTDGGEESQSESDHGSIAEYQVAFVSPNSQNCFESISNPSALPFNAVFQKIQSGVPISLPDMASGAYLGIWLSRTFDMNSPDLQTKDQQYWLDQLTTPKTLGTKEELDIVLDYTLV